MALTDNLAGYWKLDESSGNAADSSGNAATLTNTNTVAYGAAKINNGGLCVRATPSYFQVADTAPLSITGNISIAGWFKFTALPSTAGANMDLVVKWDDPNDSYRVWIANDDKLRFSYTATGDASDTVTFTETTASVTSTSVWYYIVFTVAPATKTIVLYVNGSSSGGANNAGTATAIHNNASSFAIGAVNPSTPVEPYGGYVDEVGVWSRVLTSDEVTSLYNAGAGLQYPFVVDLSISVSDTVTVSEDVQISYSLPSPIIETVTVTEDIVIEVISYNWVVAPNENITVSEDIQISYSLPSPITESVTVTEDISFYITELFLSVSDTITVSEDIQVNYSLPSPIFDSVTVSEDIQTTTANNISPSDSVTVSEDVSLFIPTMTLEVSDTITVSENLHLTGASPSDESELVTVSESIEILIANLILPVSSDSVTVSEDVVLSIPLPVVIFDSVTVSESIDDVDVSVSESLFESITVSESLSFDTTIWVYEPQQYAPRGSISPRDIVGSPQQYAPRGSISPREGLYLGGSVF